MEVSKIEITGEEEKAKRRRKRTGTSVLYRGKYIQVMGKYEESID